MSNKKKKKILSSITNDEKILGLLQINDQFITVNTVLPEMKKGWDILKKDKQPDTL